MVETLHDDIKGRITVNGTISEPFLYSSHYNLQQFVFLVPFQNHRNGRYTCYRTSWQLLNIRRFTARTKVLKDLYKELLYLNDYDLVTHPKRDTRTGNLL